MSSPSTPQQPPNNPANKSIYEAAQLRSSLKIGGSLHRGTSSRRFLGTGGTGGSFRSSLRSSSTTATPSGGWPSTSRTSRSSSFSSSSPAVAEFDVSRSAAYASSSHGSCHGTGYDSGTSYGSGSHPRSLPLPSSLRHSGRFTAATNSSNSSNNNSNHTKEVHHPYKNLQGISPSGNKLLCIRIPPEERAFLLGQNDDVEVELDRREIRMLARGGRLGDPIDDDLDVTPAHPSDDLDFNFDETATTMMMNDGGGGGSRRMVSYPGEGRLHSIPIRYDHHDDDGIDDLQQRKERLKAAYRASSVRKGIFASILIFLTAASVFFTVENFIRVRTAQDWVEPRYAVGDYGAFGGGVVGASSSSASDGAGTAGNGNTALPNDSTVGRNQHQTPSYNVAQPQLPSSSSSSLLTPATATFQYDPDGTNGGIDWTTGPDAPPPHRSHSLLPPSLLTHLADWAAGTRRLSPSSTSSLETFPDGFGSIRVDPRIAFREIPFYWGESFGGGDIVSYALGGCLGLVLAADGGISGRGEREGLLGGGGFAPGSSSFSGSESTLLQQETNDSELSLRSILGRTYVNVDLSTVEGIEQASNWKLASSGMADVVVSPHLNHIAEKVLDGQHKGRMFVLLIHPCVREFRRFRHWRKMELLHHGKGLITNKYSEEGNEDILSMSYTAYSKSHLVEDNWMTRTILDKPTESYPELTVEDMHAAKELLRTKAIIGLYDDILGAIRHYSRYFGWDGFGSGETIGERAVKCFEKSVLEGMKREDEEDELMTAVIASGSGLNQESLETPFITAQEEETREGSMAWENILERNRFDLELYLYGQKLYSYQVGLN